MGKLELVIYNGTNSEDPIVQFNKKLEIYNSLPEKDERKRLLWLEEIYYHANQLIDMNISKALSGESVEMSPILNWKISTIADELERMNKSSLLGLNVEKIFSDFNKRIIKQNVLVLYLKKIFHWLFSNEKISAIDREIKKLNQEENILPENKLYALQRIKHDIWNAINFTSLTKYESKRFKKRLKLINYYISEELKNEKLRPFLKKHETFEKEFGQKFNRAEDKQKNAVMEEFVQLHSQQRQEILRQITGSDYQVDYLGGGNNKNWLLTNEQGKKFILRVEMPENPDIINHINKTKISQFLVDDYIRFYSEGFMVFMTDYMENGDLKTYRIKEENETKIIKNTLNDFKQILNFCQICNENKMIYLDLKLTNFLVNEHDKILISDKKSFLSLESKGQIILHKFSPLSEIYAPPEFPSEENTVDAEKVSVYQIGLALYEYLAKPSDNELIDLKDAGFDNDGTKVGFKFDKPIFQTILGEQLKQLILSATHKKPEQRCTLKMFLEQLNKMEKQLQKPHRCTTEKMLHQLGRYQLNKRQVPTNNTKSLKESTPIIKSDLEEEIPQSPLHRPK